MKDPRHLAWIRTLPSVISGTHGCVAAHINFADRRYGKPERGKSKKADDRFVLPITPWEHTDGPDAQHRTGKEKAWWAARGIDATTLANDLWRVSGDTEAAMAILRETWRQRSRLRRPMQGGAC
ncbi:hypothetical protein [Mesorhizobium sp. L-8-10]|uniref:hypothetical protein n=1 Tax=Mesorhizobium sp. L-8-10 TaxID=2744523 RepID=UPI001926CB88|nr:hypothetical protein [Mesorhizobium sp. L-8-10]